MGQGLLKAQDVSRERRGPIIYDGFPQGRPSCGSGEYIHPWSPMQHFPAGPLEQAQKRGLIQMAKGIAFVGIDDQVDLG